MAAFFCLLRCQPTFQSIHILAYFTVQHLGIDLGGFQVPVAQHLTDRLDRNAIRERYGSGKSMPGQVKGQVLRDAADVGDLF